MSTTAITIPGSAPVTLEAGRRQLSESDARKLTDAIQQSSVRLWVLVTEAHDRKAHAALGYPTWDDYVRAELRMSPSRSYQLLDTGHVMKELAQAGADLEKTPIPTTRVVARVKDRLPEVRRRVKAALKDGTDPDQVLRELARKPRLVASETIPLDDSQARKPGRPPTLVVCPLCVGEGKVSRSLSARALAWMRKSEN